MIDNNAQYSGLANIMNMRDRNPNTQLAYVPNGYLNSVPTAPNPYTGIPQVNSPIAMNEGGMPSQQYPMQEEASELADRGRYGDTTLVHMTPGEVQGLASLGQLTINPDTGLPEAFNMKALLPIIGGIAGSFLLPGVGTALGASALGGLGGAALGAGLGTTAGGLLAGQSFEDAALSGVMSGAMSFGMGSLMAGVSPGLTEGVGGTVASDMAAGTTGLGGDFAYATASGAPTVSQAMSLGGTEELGKIAFESFGGDAYGNMIMPPEYTSLDWATNVPTPVAPTNISAPTIPDNLGLPGMSNPPLSSEILKPYAPPNSVPNSYFSKEAIKPGWVGRNVLGKETIPAGEITRSQFIDAGGIASDMTTMDFAKQKLSDPLTYAPLAAGAVTGAFDDPYEYEEPPPRPPVDTGFGRYTLEGGTPREPKTQEELLAIALGGGRENMFEKSYYTRNAAEGGIVGLQQGGMATPQAPSAMSAMLNTPTAQQPIPINIAVQPPQQQQQPMQQPMPMQGMGQPPQQGIQPLPDQSIEFKKNMDMEEQLQKQKTATSIQGQSALLGLIGGAGDYLQSQGMNYPTTTPSGTIPQTPAMNQGAQVNMGASGGFAQGGMINSNESTKEPKVVKAMFGGILSSLFNQMLRDSERNKEKELNLGGANSMNQLLSRNVYSNNAGSSAAAPVQSEGGAASMNQLLSNPSYSKQLAMGGLLGYNEGGMPSQEQRYFEGQVVGKGDGQSDEVPFSVDGGEVDMAMLSPDEYVLAADVVSYIGDGSSNAGAAKLDQFMEDVREQAHGSDKQINGFDERGLANLVA